MKEKQQIYSETKAFFRLLPAWKGSLILFGMLIAIVLAYFLLQVRQLQQIFLSHSLENSAMLANVIERNARSAVLSQETVEKIIQIFLGNTARFLNYLDAIEPFSEQELSEFALESGLAGIRIIREKGEISEGPSGWLKSADISCNSEFHLLHHLPSYHLFLLSLPDAENSGCIIVGLEAAHIEKLHEQIGLARLLEALSGLSGIKYVRIESPEDSDKTSKAPRVFMKAFQNTQVAETRLAFGSEVLVLGMDTWHFFARTRQLWNEFFFFSAVLAFLGFFFSWLLHRSQTIYLQRIREVERELARQHEDAALGRAAAAITHEIRNPLNAISMGLQRLQIEADELSDEYLELLKDMFKAVQRTNGIVSNIRQYAKPLEPKKRSVSLNSVIRHILSLYRHKCLEYNIKINWDEKKDHLVTADPGMLEQVIENLIKNAVEAQPEGGFIRISTMLEKPYAALSIENKGFNLQQSEASRILEPYFTTKTRGTGLGLSIVSKIIHAHNGHLKLDIPEPGILRMTVRLEISEQL